MGGTDTPYVVHCASVSIFILLRGSVVNPAKAASPERKAICQPPREFQEFFHVFYAVFGAVWVTGIAAIGAVLQLLAAAQPSTLNTKH